MIRKRTQSGQTLIIGSLLLFALVVALIVYVQVAIFPEINERTELKEQANALSSMEKIKAAIEDAASENRTQSVVYDNRITYVPQPAGPGAQLGQINMKNVTAPEIRNLNTTVSFVNAGNQFGDGSDSKIMVYKPQFVELSEDREVVYENTVVAEQNPDQAQYVPTTSQTVVSDNVINVIVLSTNPNGLNGIQGSEPTITFTPIESGSAKVTGASGNDIELEFSTKLSAGTWRSLTEAERDSGIIESVTKSGNRLTITLDGGQDYTLKYTEIRVEA